MWFSAVRAFFAHHAFAAAVAIVLILGVAMVLHLLMEENFLQRKSATQKDGRSIIELVISSVIVSVCGLIVTVTGIGSLINFARLHRKNVQIGSVHEKHMKAIETSREGIAVLDAKGCYTYMNRAHAQCYGYEDAEELMGQSWHNFYTPEKKEELERKVFPELRAQGWWSGASVGLKRGGQEFAQELSLSTLEDGGLVCTVRDVSADRERQGLLRLIKLAVEAAEDGIAIADVDNRLLFLNKSYLSLHGYNPHEQEQYIGTDWRMLYNHAGQDQINSIVLPTAILKGSWSGTIPVMRRDGILFYSDASLTKLPDGLILGVMRDVTERRQAQLEHEALRERLHHAQKMEAIFRLSDGIATDFGEVLNQISGQAKVVRELRPEDEITANMSKDILRACERANELIDQLHAFALNKNVRTGAVNVAGSVDRVCERMAAQLPGHIDILKEMRVRDAHAHANPAQVEQVIANLCQNAKESIRHRGKIALVMKEADWNLLGLRSYLLVDELPEKRDAAQIGRHRRGKTHYLTTGRMLRGQRYFQLSISDNGQGIQPDILSSIFDPFFTTKGGGESTAPGMGLSTVHGIMLGLNGAIVVETVPGEGTSVHLFFPRADRLEERGAVPFRQAV